jgi:hypothetical protein
MKEFTHSCRGSASTAILFTRVLLLLITFNKKKTR